MQNDLMTIRQMCDMFELTPRTLRFYEAKELLFPFRRGNRRLFSARDRARLRIILKGKRFGLSLEALRNLLNLYDQPNGSALQMQEAYRLAMRRLSEMKQERIELDQSIVDLKLEIERIQDHHADDLGAMCASDKGEAKSTSSSSRLQ